ncbi:hypothetical protein HHK36_002371 [Tetracentron sinense]|uniref:Protein kinase domain-containing protein n=1 Tax=Tetracentron sinense TaxID=13715 RepID=A0A834ZRA1_TETSI|nr:hypothetical protein HHK36_002371 [Tetracentron sinense]
MVPPPGNWITAILLAVLVMPAMSIDKNPKSFSYHRFNGTHYSVFTAVGDASINGGALQITPDSVNDNFSLLNKSGRVMFSTPFKLWEKTASSNHTSSDTVASFNSTFLINIFRKENWTGGEGLAFVIAPDLSIPSGSDGGWLGLTNATTDGDPSNQIVAIELDTVKQEFDPDDNHIGLDINSVRSNKTVSLSDLSIEISPASPKNYSVWVQYNGTSKVMDVYMAEEGKAKPTGPVLSEEINLKQYVKQHSYMGFAASTSREVELNCVLAWDLTVENLEEEKKKDRKWVKIGVPVLVLLLVMCGVGLGYYWHKRREAEKPINNNILGSTLKSLPGTPREFRFRDLKKATNNFDEKLKLGQGGFGVVFKGVLPKENLEVAVKKFSREKMKGIDDFLAELSIINRLRHKHLVRLLGWCHKNGTLLLVYEYMPNGSLDNHLFGGEEKTLSWDRRYKILSGVASALHYLHNEYDEKVVHRDLKASNIMLDSNYNARLGDFGLARALENEKTSYAELEGFPGTFGYIAPESLHTGKATRESDVFGFGAVVLEVVCGQRPWTKIQGFHFLVDWVWSLYREGRILEAVDERLGKDYVVEEAEKLLLLGLACSHPIAGERPRAQEIVQITSGSMSAPDVPPFKPAFVWASMPPTGDTNTTADSTPITTSYYGSGWTPQVVSRESYVAHTSNSLV